MRFRSRTNAFVELTKIKERLLSDTAAYETKALSCDQCPTQGSCCRDEHFVNVRVSAIEAEAIINATENLSADLRDAVYRRANEAATKLQKDLNSGTEKATYSCPLYDPGLQCLVHTTAKPSACIFHGCYEKKEDLPPDQLLDNAEASLKKISRSVYGKDLAAVAIPLIFDC